MKDLEFNTMNINLIISGGGFRATLFHLGVAKHLVKLNLFEKIRVISSVSGGSILNALISLHFEKIKSEEDFIKLIEEPIIKMIKGDFRNNVMLHTIFAIKSKSVKKILNKRLYHNKKMSDLSDKLTSIINATDINQGRRWIFTQDKFGGFDHDYSDMTEKISISKAVHSSMAFPGLVSPEIIKKEKYNFPIKDNVAKKIQLIDGGVYDNTGIFSAKEYLGEPNTLNIASDTIEVFSSTKKKLGLLNQFKRVFFLVLDLKTRKERSYFVDRLTIKKNEKENCMKNKIKGVIFLAEKTCKYYKNICPSEDIVPDTINSIPDSIGYGDDIVKLISRIRTDLDRFSDVEIDCLMYHGASLLDVSLRKWHPDIYKNCNTAILNKPNYTNKKLKKALSKSDKTRVFRSR